MPAPYSYDLRAKAVSAYHRGEKKIAICRLMKISRNTLDLWLQREQETGDFKTLEKIYVETHTQKTKEKKNLAVTTLVFVFTISYCLYAGIG